MIVEKCITSVLSRNARVWRFAFVNYIPVGVGVGIGVSGGGGVVVGDGCSGDSGSIS